MAEVGSSGGKRSVMVALAALVLVVGGGLIWKGTSPRRPGGEGPSVVDVERRRVSAADPSFDPAAPAGTMEGLVNDAGGQPVDGAVVAIVRQRGRDELPSMSRPTPRTAITARGGRFQLTEVLPGEYGVTATALVGSPARQSKVVVTSGKNTQLTLTLGRQGRLFTGEVEDVGGGSIAGARATFRQFGLAFRPGEEPPVFQVVSDAQGIFKIRLGAGDFELAVAAPGYAPARDRLPMDGDLSRRYRLHPAARLSGRVRDRATSDPVPGATVWLRLDRIEGWVDREAKSDHEGRFTFDDLAAGGYVVMARLEGRVGLSQAVGVGIAQAAEVDVFVERGRSIKGLVVGSDGKGLASIRVVAGRMDPPYERPVFVHSGGDGTFSVEGLLPARYRVSAWAEGRGQSKAETAQVTSKDVLGVRLELSEVIVVKGMVVNGAGSAVAGATVTGTVQMKGPEPRYAMDRATTDGAGRFELGRLAPGQLTITAKHPEQGNARWGPDDSAKAQSAGLVLRTEAGASIAGLVKYEDGAPAAGATVMSQLQQARMISFGPPEQVTTDAEGRFRLGGLEPGRMMLMARRNDVSNPGPRARQEVTLAAGEQKTGVELTVVAGGKRIVGKVVDPLGQPVSGAVVTAGQEIEGASFRMPVREGGPAGNNAVSDPDGNFVLDDLQEGQYSLWATDTMHADGELKGIATGTAGVTIRMQGGASVAGTVRTSDGRPVVDYTIAALPAARPGGSADERFRQQNAARVWSPSAQVHDPAGSFLLTRLSAGGYELTVTTADGQGGVLPVTVTAGEKKQGLAVILAAASKIVGRVVELEGGLPLEGVNVHAVSPTARLTALTGKDGSFTVTGLPPGRARIDLRLANAETHLAEYVEVEVKSGGGDLDLGAIKMMKGNMMDLTPYAERGRPGFTGALVDGKPAITRVRPGFPAEKLGLKEGDLLLAVNGKSTEGLGNGALGYVTVGKVSEPLVLKVQPREGGPPREVRIMRAPMDFDPARPPPPAAARK